LPHRRGKRSGSSSKKARDETCGSRGRVGPEPRPRDPEDAPAAKGLQDHVGANVRGVLFRLEDAVGSLRRHVEATNAAAEREVRGVADAEKRLVGLVDELGKFIAELPVVEVPAAKTE
jgi:hypothetical protein